MKLFWSHRREELAEEIRSHLEMAAADRMDRGETAEEAASGARREFGNVPLVAGTVEAQWAWEGLRRVWLDARYGVRAFAKNPGFTAVAVLTLALGIGGNATVFSWIRGVLLNPLPGVAASSELAAVESVMPDGEYHTSSYPDFTDYRAKNHSFSDMIGFEFVGVDMSMSNAAPVERVWGLIATENYFDVLRVNAALGRVFHEEQNQAPNSDPYIVLGNGFWKRRFGGRPDAVGKTLRLNGHPFTVIGVAPPGFHGTIVGIDAEYFVPMMMQPEVLPSESLTDRNPTFIHMMGRLKSGVTIEQAQAEMATLAGNLAREYPDSSKGVGIFVAPVWKAHYGVQDFLRSVLGFLMVVAAFVLLIACVNVANLLLARATTRQEEIAIRAALGADRLSLIRQLLVESLLLAGGGGIGGVLLALWGVKLLSLFAPAGHLPVALSARVDGPVLAFTLGLTLVTAMVFGLAPALRASRTDLNTSLKHGARRIGSPSGAHLRSVLVISEVALATVLLVSAGLLVRSVRNAEMQGPGFQTDHIALAAFDLRASGYSGAQASLFFERLAGNLRELPGVEAVTLERYVPLWFTGRSYTPVEIEGYTPQRNEDMEIDLNVVGTDYFRTLRIPMVAGRDFTQQDGDETPRVVIVNQTMANRFWPGRDATGHRLHAWDQWWTVVGVARDVKYHRMNEPPQPFLYLPVSQTSGLDVNLLVRSQMPTATVIGAIRNAARSLDAKIQPLETDDLGGLLHVSLFANRTAASVGSILGGLGLFLAALGVYGVLSYTVNQRLGEIAIRMAMGAQARDVLSLVGGTGFKLIAIGGFGGALFSLIVVRAISGLLFGVSASDPMTFSAAGGLLILVAVAACCVPARRAMKVDPMTALRHE
jgi:predicted permease